MPAPAENLRLILGLKLRQLRHQQDASLKQVAARAGISVSYLSELEQGRKYPKPDKLLALAEALGIPYDDLVSSKVGDELDPVKQVLGSELLREFPFELFGLEREDLLRLLSEVPGRARALVQTLVEIGRSYDIGIEHFLLSALRSYQQMHHNHFPELEEAAEAFRREQGEALAERPGEGALRALLESRWGYRIDSETLPASAELASFRSVFVDGERPTLHVNGRLLPVQRTFLLAREIGYRVLDLEERAVTSSWLEIESFAQLLNNFRASYFAGAVLMSREAMRAELQRLFAERAWSGEAFLDCMRRFDATPEMFLYRLTELVPELFGLERLFFLRFQKPLGSDSVTLTKVFNLSEVTVPYGVGLREHYCRRWPGVALLGEGAPAIAAQRSRFVDPEVEFFVVSLARPLALDPSVRSSVSIGFLLDEELRRTLGFWGDPEIPTVEVGLTCERCPLGPDECRDRVAPAEIFDRRRGRELKERALGELIAAATGSSAAST